jgi:hypothetical protein
MLPSRKSVELTLRKRWASDAQVLQLQSNQLLGELRGLAVKRGSVSRYRLCLHTGELILTPLIKAHARERPQHKSEADCTRNFTGG